MKIRLIRHATLWLEATGQQIPVDPMFADRCAFPSLTVGQTAMKKTHSHFDHYWRFF